MESFILEKSTQTVEIEGLPFTLQEMSAKELRDYTNMQLALNKAVRELLSNPESASAAALEEIELKLLQAVLRDKDGIVDKDFLEVLSPNQKKRLFEIQDSLNGVADVLKKIQNTIAEQAAEK